MPESFRVGLVGYGYAGRTFHAPLIASTPGLSLAGIVSRDPEKVRCDFPEVEVYRNASDMFADGRPDLAVIATPNDSHYSIAAQALEAGCHVVVDKPFTVTLDQATKLGRQASASERLLSVFHNRRWDDDFLTLRRAVADGRLGAIVHFENRFERYRPEVRDRWREREGAGAGLWFDLGPHLVDQTLQLMGRPISVYADIAQQRTGARVDDCFHVVLQYPQGRRAILHAAMLSAGPAPRFVVHGTAGTFESRGLDPQEEALKRGERPGAEGWAQRQSAARFFAGNDGPPTPVSLEAGRYQEYYRAISQAMAGRARNPVPPEDAIAVMEILEAGCRSAGEGRVVALPPAWFA